jgi:hypothetical protein
MDEVMNDIQGHIPWCLLLLMIDVVLMDETRVGAKGN